MKQKISHITGSLRLLLGLLFSTHFLTLYPPINFSLSASSLSRFHLLSCPVPPLLFLSFIFHSHLSSFLLPCSLFPLFSSTPLLFPIFFSFLLLSSPLLPTSFIFPVSFPSLFASPLPSPPFFSLAFHLLFSPSCFLFFPFLPSFSFAQLYSLLSFPCSFSFPLLSSTLLSHCYLSYFPHISFPFLSFPFLSFPFLSFPFPPLPSCLSSQFHSLVKSAAITCWIVSPPPPLVLSYARCGPSLFGRLIDFTSPQSSCCICELLANEALLPSSSNNVVMYTSS